MHQPLDHRMKSSKGDITVQPMNRSVLVLITTLFCSPIHAQMKPAPASGDSAMTIEDAAASEKKNKVSGDLDKEITNPKIRADSGSKSKWSMSTGLNYRGGSVSRPFGVERPDLLGLPENQIDTSLDANIKARYRTSKNSSYTLGAALGMKTPFHGDVNAKENQTNVGDPVLGYNRTFAANGLQNTWNLAASMGATDESKNVDLIGGVSTDYTFMKVLGRGFQVGLQGVTFYNFYSTEPGDNAFTATNRVPEKNDTRTEWSVSFNPTLEYHINDRLSFRTLFSYFRWRNLYGDDQTWRLLRLKEYQSIGLGIVATRDVYLYPNVQFLPRDVRGDYTNFAMSASMNLF